MKLAGLQKRIRAVLFAKNLRGWLFALLVLLVVALRMAVAASQRVYLLPEGSGIDDMLMIRAAQSITQGQWLGPYGGLAIAKNMGFALWLALLHALHLPVLLANAALWLAACGFAAWCLRPVLRGNLGRLVVFAFLAFQPLSYAFFTQRVYRDAIFPALSLLFFAGVLGLCLRLAALEVKGCLFAAAGAGAGFAGAWLTREDGPVLLVFGVCAALVMAAFVLFSKALQKRVIKLLCVVLPFLMLGGGILGFSAANRQQYGVFMVNDLTEGDFPAAYGALAAVSQAESGYTPLVPVTQQALAKLYKQVPLMAELRPQLESSELLNGFANKQTGEYGGSFYFALRLAAEYGGFTPGAAEAQALWGQLLAQVRLAVAEGRLQSGKPASGTVPIWNSALLGPTVAETGKNMLAMFTFSGAVGPRDMRPLESVGPPEKIQAVADYLYSPVQQGYIAGTDEPYYNPVQKVCFALCDLLTWVYRVLLWPLAALALVFLLQTLFSGVCRLFKNRRAGLLLVFAVLVLGLVFSVLLRAAVAAYMEVAAFNIGVYLMYLAGAMPPLLLFCVAGASLPVLAEKADAG